MINSSALMMGDEGYTISRSVRLRSSASAYFNRTPSSASNRTTYTFSAWVKRGTLSAAQTILSAGTNASTTGLTIIQFESNDTLMFYLDDGTTSYRRTTTQVFRDPSSWYHIVCVLDTTQATAANRLKVYVNGSEITAFSTATNPNQNTTFAVDNTQTHNIGRYVYDNTRYFDGYLTEINFIDGQALTPSSFGETNAVTGVWQAKKYSGTYGTNGFYLNFSDNSAATAAAIGKDYSGNGNNWTPNNISVTAGVTYDSMLDTPTPYTDGGNNRGNYAVFNPLWQGRTNSPTNGNLDYAASSVGIGTMDVSQFSSYWEITSTGGTTTASVYSTAAATTVSVTTGLTYGFRFNSSTGALDYTTNGSSFTSLATGLTSGPYFVYVSTAAGTTASFNGGQRPFTYTLPTGFDALNTFNLPTPTIANGATVMAATTYTGTGSSLTIANTVNGVSFQPDFVWVKGRSGATDHALYDSVRGTTKDLVSNSTAAETTQATGLTAFGSTGFTVGALAKMNTNTATYVGWQWKAGGTSSSNTNGSITSTVSVNATAGFSVVTWTGTGANATVGHGLGVAPSMIINKPRNAADNWISWHTTLGATGYIYLNLTNASNTGATVWNSTLPSSTVFSVGTSSNVNTNGQTMVSYCFSAVAGYSAFGSYTGNGSNDGTFVYCGFRPRFVMFKRTNSTSNWLIIDSSRGSYNPDQNRLFPNLSNAEDTSENFDLLSNGFKCRDSTGTFNASGGSYIFAAFAENPMKYALAR